MKIYLKNFELDTVFIVLNNVTSRSEIQKNAQGQKEQVGINGLTALNLTRLMKDIGKERADWQEHQKKLLDKHVEGGSENPRTEGGNYIFKSKEDKEAYLEVADAFTPINVRTLLSNEDLTELKVVSREFFFLSLVTEMDARFEKPKDGKVKAKSTPNGKATEQQEKTAKEVVNEKKE